ncbi:MAG: transposase [Dysosmobacter sp.]|uniref:transposase n=1 Tax=Dysosmobacter sp. TaxID=2591382 RepID=UPI00283FD7C1|nr:transposase [Dysosmobacter sp.]MDR3983340.1 transposase [Dysosmobacter sp.]
MAKSKYETHVLPNLKKISKWAAAGATAKEIAGKLRISYSTLRRYLDQGSEGDEQYAALWDAFTQACGEADDQVEAALYKRACGYRFEEVTIEDKLDRDGIVHTLTKKVTRDIPPDPTSAMFWLTNRRRDRWKYRPDDASGGEDGGTETGVVELPAVAPLEPPAEDGSGQNGT